MKCYVCGMQYADDEEKCPSCEFPAIHAIGDDADNAEIFRDMITSYRKDKIKSLEVCIRTYSWDAENDDLAPKETEISLGLCGEKTPGEITWTDEVFWCGYARAAEINLIIKRPGGAEKILGLNVPIPAQADVIHAGIQIDSEGLLSVVLGVPGQYTRSQAVNIL